MTGSLTSTILLWLAAIGGVVGALGTLIFGFGPWRERLRKPRLAVSLEPMAGGSRSGQERVAWVPLALVNSGSAPARSWSVRLRLQTPTAPSVSLRLHGDLHAREQDQYADENGAQVLLWKASDETDLLLPEENRSWLFEVMFRGDPFDATVSFEAIAPRAKPIRGTISVTFTGQRPEMKLLP